MSRHPLLYQRQASLFALTTVSMALALLLAGCPARGRTSSTSTLRVLHSFGGADGAWPRGSLVAAGGFLYGGTTLGGDAKNGTVFRVRPDGTGFESLYSFTPGRDNGLGNQPHHNSMLLVGNMLVGAARQGGNTDNNDDEGAQKFGNGTIFRIETSGSGYSILQKFDGGERSGATPHSPPQI